MIISIYKKYGFTLVELSIVLVIIGLIIGGILVGRDLIEAGKVRAQLNQISDIETQINTFQLKYNCLPGDCATATSIFGTSYNNYTIRDSDEDGVIRAQYAYGTQYTNSRECTVPDVTGEVSQLLLQLNAAGLGKYTANGQTNGANAIVGREYTLSAYDRETGMFVSCLSSTTHPAWTPSFFRTGNIMVIGAASRSVGRIIYALGTAGKNSYGTYGYYAAGSPLVPIGIPANAIRQMDEKIDDGKPSSGKFGIIEGDVGCASNVAAYPAPDVYCRVTAEKRVN